MELFRFSRFNTPKPIDSVGYQDQVLFLSTISSQQFLKRIIK